MGRQSLMVGTVHWVTVIGMRGSGRGESCGNGGAEWQLERRRAMPNVLSAMCPATLGPRHVP